MIEREIVDRVPTYPGRYKLTPVEGQPDLFDFERADEPLVEGSPLNKATLDSIIQSRLTGRYYKPDVVRTQSGSQNNITVNPIPASGWVLDSTRTVITNVGYKITASSTQGQADPDRAIDGDSSSYWSSSSGTTHTFTLQLDEAIKIKKMNVKYKAEDFVFVPVVTLQGSTNGETWVKLWTKEANMSTKTEIELTSPGLYSYYRLSFVHSDDVPIYLYDFEISEYDISFYHNEFTIENGLPETFTPEQRLMIIIPENAITMGVTTNSLNGIAINTILHPAKRYELRYTGSVFAAKEV